MARIVKVIFDAAGGGTVAGYNVKTNDLTPLALLDESNAATGLTLNYDIDPSGLSNSGYALGARHGYSEAAIKETTAYTGSSFSIVLSGVLTDEKITNVKMWGCSAASGSDRVADYTLLGTTISHDAKDYGAAAPASFSVDVSAFPVSLLVAKGAGASFAYAAIMEITLESTVATGPTITGPDSTTEGAVTVQTGTLQDTVVTQSLVSGSYSIAQTIDSATATTLNYIAESGVNLCTPSTPVAGVPLAATISAAGITPYVVQQKADDGVNTPATRNITLNPEATHEVVQTMIAVANTIPDQSIFGTNIIIVEDDMQAYAPKTANGMAITWAADGTFGTGTTDQTEVIDVFFFAPSTGNWSCISLTIQDTSIIAVGMATDMVASMVSNMVEDM